MRLVIDFGNTCIKAGIFTKETLIEAFVYEVGISHKVLLNDVADFRISKVFFGTASHINKWKKFYSGLKQYFKSAPRIFTKSDFANMFDLKQYENVNIGTDILALNLFLKTNYGRACGFCLGTAYWATIVENKFIRGVVIAPNVVNSLNGLLETTNIKTKLPDVYEKEIGYDTITALEAGTKNMIEGFVINFAKYAKRQFNIDKFIITGGDMQNVSYLKSNKVKFELIEHGVLHGYNILAEEEQL